MRCITMPEINLTKEAIKNLSEAFDEYREEHERVKPGTPFNGSLRVCISGGGCAGFSWSMTIDEEVYTTDVVLYDKEFIVRTDDLAVPYLDNATIKYTVDNTGMVTGYGVDLPLAKTMCGCGKSFSL
ncbi:HesB/IscA family protein [Vibrio splendidus]